ncbi:serine/threonine-protein kinase Sgk1-like [Acanthaster planci]|uniref:Serine/threonine-protein kinase Sgk1-like n=1 Tax=Acanthaster planci TaxID=133434 RepID=A0A8B7ZA69_ACAPL|nr:serine/threonine-protein kinase Sgk1-like [Acanthaster planci]XP_022102564.1 serine/threonine-protein kinase Sgk1-like [Acanthaster planci]XP_022102565.1 serine/threonine-protein kinase Sgk1-like [Acanthaster planci]XP_022102566.1 serine/threonine-protein kinase Sgk1-like [Acanthaster planci]XP_022102567.1 serine/threonine-protein kinase Sgk1-like [Acanthaster planci]
MAANSTSVHVSDTQTWEKNKKTTVYKVVVVTGGKTWFIFRRYNEFHKLYEMLKKKFPEADFKLPGKKLFGNNFDPEFIRQRREGLHDFIQKIITNPKILKLPDVQNFLSLDDPRINSDNNVIDENNTEYFSDPKDPNTINLGPSANPSARPSDFDFLKVIGKGSFGKVLLAKHKHLGKVYAVKVLEKKAIMQRNEQKHIMAERNVLLKNLKHPFLVSLHYSFQTPDKLYFVLDYINGGELFFHLQRERNFPEPRARFYAAEIASAIGYLHSLDIIYRDLKPENILLDSEGHVVLTDFGLCKEGIEAKGTTSTFCGTPEYLAPEVLRKQEYDRSVDWWCLGAVLYEMLSGLPPFYSRDTAEMYDNILHKPLRMKSNFSAPAKSILEGMLQKDRKKRLGAGVEDFKVIRNHEFFDPIDWEQLDGREITPPFNPSVSSSMDTKNIDPEFVREPVPQSVGRSIEPHMVSASVQEADSAFTGFTYVPPSEAFDD